MAFSCIFEWKIQRHVKRGRTSWKLGLQLTMPLDSSLTKSEASRTDPVWPLLGKPTLYSITVMRCNISFASVLSSLPHMVHLIWLCRGAVRRYGAARLARLRTGHQIQSFSKYHMVKHLRRTLKRNKKLETLWNCSTKLSINVEPVDSFHWNNFPPKKSSIWQQMHVLFNLQIGITTVLQLLGKHSLYLPLYIYHQQEVALMFCKLGLMT